jgi:ABC-type lipoprotein release transport system permease subunit
MLFVIIPVSIVLLGVIIYLALSPKSAKMVRLAALCALGAIMLSVIICVIIIFAGMGGAEEEPVMPDFLTAEAPVPATQGNPIAIILLAVFMLAFLGIIVFLSMRERKRQED